MKAAPEVLDKALRAGWVAFLAAGNIDIVIAAAIDSLPEPESADEEIAALKAENARLKVSPEKLSERLDHSRTCDAGYNLDSNGCTCGLAERIQLQTEQNIRSAWMKRSLGAEQEIAKLKAENARLRDLLRQWYGFSDGEWTNKISLRYETHAVFTEKEKA